MKFKNIIELCSDIDYASFRKSILRKCLDEYFTHAEKIDSLNVLSESDKEIWTSISYFTDMRLLLTPYSNTSLGDFDVFGDEASSNNTFENSFIGFRDYVTHITYPTSLRSTVFEIIRLRNPEYFFKEKDYYDRLYFDTLKLPENTIISTKDGDVVVFSNEIIPDIIGIILQFRHTLMTPVIYKQAAGKILNDIILDTSNGVNDLLEGFD